MTDNRKFLDSVARYVLDTHDDLSRLTLVFPNKRSAMFLKKYIQDRLVRTSARPRFMPRFATMGNFVSRFATRAELPRQEQLFLLYDCYRRLLAERGREEQLRDFDKFIFWGGMILDDFDDVDRQLVDASKLFKNLKNLKEINADYLDDDLKRLVRQIWGDSARTTAVTEFWTHIKHTDEGENPETQFINLWELLGDLYKAFKAALHQRVADTAGGQYRDAAEVINGAPAKDLSSRRYLFIGFNDLSHSELIIFKRLKDLGLADFFWDFDGKFFEIALTGRLKSHVDKLRATFPMPDDFEAPTNDSLPEIEVVAVPSGIAQAKSTTEILERWENDGLIDASNAIDTAIVVPDEKLLMPLLLSIPETIPAVNITMGVPFSETAFASMLHSLIALQLRAREIRGRLHYYYADVIEVLSHPHIQVIAPATAESIKRDISKNNLFNLDALTLCESYPEVRYLFDPVKQHNDANGIYRYMTNLIGGLSEALSRNACAPQGGLPELEILDYFSKGIADIHRLIDSYGVTMNEGTYFALFERLMQSRRIDLQGTPLRGMQIMGVLETRALDFDNLIILSMNENSFPRKSYMRTMIPNNLRVGYGMNSIDRQDSLYTYYFYRLISRARRVKLIYDSRTGSFGSGEASRYIAQLEHFAAEGTIKSSSMQFPSDFNAPEAISIPKDDEVMGYLKRFMPGGNAFLSASALKEYKKCRLRFYLRYVRNLRGENEVEDYISPSVYGTIVHRVVELLYTPYQDKFITEAVISGILDSPDLIDNTVAQTVFDLYYRNARYSSPDSMPAEGLVTCSVIGLYIRKMLMIERERCKQSPFRYVKGEKKVESPPAWQLTAELGVNFKMSIDRVDEISPGYLRFIDYKTGGDKVEPTTIEKLFRRERHDDEAVFQLMTYCLAYHDMVDPECSIKPEVYPFRIMASTGEIPLIKIEGEEVNDYKQFESEFRERLTSMISEIFSRDVPFDQAEDPNSCTFCPFLDLCNKTVPERY